MSSGVLTMTPMLDLPERYKQQLLALLDTYVPEVEAWAYGSRVQGTNHEASDLDIVLRGPNLAELGTEFFELVEAVKESTIPILIDIFDWGRLPESFHREIEREYVVMKETRPWREPEMIDQHGRQTAIDLDPSHRRTVSRLLQGYVPGCEVRAYGPRVEWKAVQHSRLDLAVLGASSVDAYALSDLRAAFQRSHLPFGVNVTDWDTIPAELRRQITQRHVVLQPSGSPDKWRTVTLGEVAIINDRQITKNHSLPFIDYLDTGSVTDGRIDSWQRLVPCCDKIPSRARRLCLPGDIVYSTVRPNQRHYGMLHELPENAIVSTGFAVIRADETTAHNEYVYWYLAQDHIVEQFQATAEHSTSAYPSIKANDLEGLSIRLPPIHEQKKIAAILSALDKRIELNRQMCETLEETAQALFKSWFVDFDPVRAKMEGRWREGESLPGLPAHLYDLFPDRLAESELGPVPADWSIISIGDAVTVHGGSTPSTKNDSYWDGEHIFVTPRDLADNTGCHIFQSARRITDAGLAKISSRLLPAGTVLMSSRAPIGHLGISTIPMAINQGIIAMVGRVGLSSAYLINWAKMYMHLVEANSGGSTFAEINKSTFRTLPFLLPASSLVAGFEDVCAEQYAQIRLLEEATIHTVEVRDSLLPKLISGEVRLPGVTEAVER